MNYKFYVGMQKEEKICLLVKQFYPYTLLIRTLFPLKMLMGAAGGPVALIQKIFLSCYSCSYTDKNGGKKCFSAVKQPYESLFILCQLFFFLKYSYQMLYLS